MSFYHFIETRDEDSQIVYVSVEFQVAGVGYMAIFCDDRDTLFAFEQNQKIAEVTKKRNVYSIKFAVKDYIDSGNENLYAPPLNHLFKKAEIQDLKNHLEKIVFEHYQLFKPDCYIFVADRPSLARMYRKMCCNPSNFMKDFVSIFDLDDEQNYFIIKTPTYFEDEEQL